MRINAFGMAVAMVLLACEVYAQNEVVKNGNFNEGLKYWRLPEISRGLSAADTGFKIEMVDGIPCLVAFGTEKKEKGKKNYQIVQHIPLSQSELLGKKVIFSADMKAEKISGTFHFMIREAEKKGTIRYRKITLNKWSPKNWKRYTAKFVVFEPTENIQVYFQTNYLEPGDKILIKNVSVTLED